MRFTAVSVRNYSDLNKLLKVVLVRNPLSVLFEVSLTPCNLLGKAASAPEGDQAGLPVVALADTVEAVQARFPPMALFPMSQFMWHFQILQ